jgi:hypothetical protein
LKLYEEVLMDIINHNSLYLTLDNLNEAFFMEKPLSQPDKDRVARWLAGRQGKPGSYHGMFAPTEHDLTHGVRLFSGEIIVSKAAIKHILGEETCRALLQLDVPDSDVREALQRAAGVMMARLSTTTGFY